MPRTLEIVRALRHQQIDQPLALQLQRERAVELERGGQQHDRAHRLAEQLLHGGWIVLVLAQVQPGVRQAHRVAANRMPFENEATNEIRPSATVHQPASFFFSRSLSCAGFALPPVAFMTWPTKKPNSLSLPER